MLRATVESQVGPDSSRYVVETERNSDPRAAIARALVEANLSLIDLQSASPSLEDIFLRVISTQREVA